MATNGRAKGSAAEREVAKIMMALLDGTEIKRNLEQTRGGGHDLDGIPGWAPEVKRYKDVTPAMVDTWWIQAKHQGTIAGLHPVLIYRADRRPWRARISSSWAGLSPMCGEHGTIEMSLPTFAQLVKCNVQQS